jgi:hypothetical protein
MTQLTQTSAIDSLRCQLTTQHYSNTLKTQ